jgi:hypothetical protein
MSMLDERRQEDSIGRRLVRALLRSRLAHFCVLGGLIFAVAPRPPSGSRIELSRDYLALLHAELASREHVSQLSAERAHEVDLRAVEDELLFREAQRLGLDQGDPLLRQHLIQKMLLLVEDLGGASRAPNEPQLRTYFEQTRSRWQRPEVLHFVHVFVHDPASAQKLEAALAKWRPGQPVPSLGEPFPVSRDVLQAHEQVAATFGDEFARAVSGSTPGHWVGPLHSRYGWHWVYLVTRSEALRVTR